MQVNLDKEETVSSIVFDHPVVSPEQKVETVSEMFLNHPEFDYYPVIKDEKVHGMIWRRDLMDLLARKFGQELHAKKSVKHVMDKTPAIVEAKTSLVDLSRLVTESRDFGSRDAFIIEKQNKYLGCGDFRDLLRKMTDLKVQSAQYANPLSGLPGNVPIQKQLNKFIKNKRQFMVMYIDVDNFKPFNDYYSFEEGDGVIGLISEILSKVVPEEHILHGESFVGHIGGDDFVIMSTYTEKNMAWAEKILKRFEDGIVDFYCEEDLTRGGIKAVNRKGESQFYPVMSLSIGIIQIKTDLFSHTQKIASFATRAKKKAKAIEGNSFFIYEDDTEH